MFTLTAGKRMDWGKKIPGYCNSTEKNSASLDEVGVIEMEKNGRRNGERKGEKRKRKVFLAFNK